MFEGPRFGDLAQSIHPVPVLFTEDVANLLGCPNIEAPFLTFTVGIERRSESTFCGAQIAQAELHRFANDALR